MIIAQISDTHLALDTPDARQRIDDFERVIADVNALDPAPDIIVHTGDVVQNGLPEEYAEATRILSAARAPVYAMVGNKDNRINFRAAFTPDLYYGSDSEFIEYVVEDLPVRLLMLDTLNLTSNKGEFSPLRARQSQFHVWSVTFKDQGLRQCSRICLIGANLCAPSAASRLPNLSFRQDALCGR